MRYYTLALAALFIGCADAPLAPDHACGNQMVAVLAEHGVPLTVRQDHATAPGQATAYYERWFYLATVEAFAWGGLSDSCHRETLPRRPGDLS